MKAKQLVVTFLIVSLVFGVFSSYKIKPVHATTDLIDSYDPGVSTRLYLQALHPSTGSDKSDAGQSFTVSTLHNITSCEFYLRKSGAATGLAHAVLYAHTGTYGTNGKPTGSALATSDDFDVSTLTTSDQLITFTFNSSQQYTMAADTYYCIVYENPTSGTINASRYVLFGEGPSPSYHSGNSFDYESSNWYSDARDACFYVYGESPPDIISPTYSSISVNNTIFNQPSQFDVLWADETNMSGFIFGTNNTGAWTNETWTSTWSNWPTTKSAWANVTKTLNGTVGAVVQYEWWANDTSNNWNNTGIQTLTTTPDVTSPTYSNVGTSTNAAGQPCIFYAKWTDNVDLTSTGGFIFGTNNTGTWQNDTWTAFSANPDWSNKTKTLNSSIVVVQWRIWANDTSNNWNDTGLQSLTTAKQGYTLGTTPGSCAETYPFQVHSFGANGRFWVFWSDGVNMVYSSSIYGTSWTKTNMRISDTGRYCSLWFDGTYIHYVFSPDSINSSTYYRKGTPLSNGTIEWVAPEQLVIGPSEGVYRGDPAISVDSNGCPWISYRDENLTSGGFYPYVTKSSTNDGTWVTEGGFPFQLSTTSQGDWGGSSAPLTAGKVLVIYAVAGAPVKTRCWNGSAFEAEIASAANIRQGELYCATVDGDTVHFTYLKATSYDVLYSLYNYTSGSFSGETTVYASAAEYSGPTISRNPDTGSLYVFWCGDPTAGHIYYKMRVDGVWDTDPTDWVDESVDGFVLGADDRLSVFPETYSGYIGLTYSTIHSPPHNVKFIYIDLTPPTYSDVSHSSTNHGMPCQFSCKWEDFVGLSGGVFGTNNTGSWQNETWAAFTANPDWSNITKTLNSTAGLIIGYEWWANDTSNNWGDTGIQTLTTTNTAPTIGEFQAPATAYPYQSFMVNVTVQDADGKAELKNCTLSLNTTGIDLTWLESDNSTAIVDASNYGELASATIATVNSTAFKISWTIKLYWNATEGTIGLDSNTKVFDDFDTSGSTTTGSFVFEDDLIITSATVDDGHTNPGQTVTVTGQACYFGTATPPTNITDIRAWLQLDVPLTQKANTTTINATGYFTFSIASESTFIQHNYTLYVVTDENSVTNGSVNIIVDRLSVLFSSSNLNPTQDDVVTISWTITRQYDGSVVASFVATMTKNGGGWRPMITDSSVTDTETDVGSHTYDCYYVSDDTYGLTGFDSTPVTVNWQAKPGGGDSTPSTPPEEVPTVPIVPYVPTTPTIPNLPGIGETPILPQTPTITLPTEPGDQLMMIGMFTIVGIVLFTGVQKERRKNKMSKISKKWKRYGHWE